VSARCHCLWQVELHPVALVNESLIRGLDIGVSWVAEGVVGETLGLEGVVGCELRDVKNFILWLAFPVDSDGTRVGSWLSTDVVATGVTIATEA
jgi:hypothetical protein